MFEPRWSLRRHAKSVAIDRRVGACGVTPRIRLRLISPFLASIAAGGRKKLKMQKSTFVAEPSAMRKISERYLYLRAQQCPKSGPTIGSRKKLL
jgi:hypothetical protein